MGRQPMRLLSPTGLLARPERTSNAGLQILSIFGAAAIVALTAFFTSAQAQYGYGYPRSYAGYFAPGALGPGFGPGYYEVTEFPTTYYDLPPYEEPAFGGYGDGVSYCLARFRSYDPYTGVYWGYDGFPHRCP